MIEITPSRISEADDERESSMVKNQEIFTLTVSDWQNTSEFQAEFGNIETGTLEANSKTSKANVNEESEDLDEIEKLERELEEQMLEEELRLQKELEDQLNLKLEQEEEAILQELKLLEEEEAKNSTSSKPKFSITVSSPSEINENTIREKKSELLRDII